MPTNILPSQIQSGGVNQNQVLAWDGSNWAAATTVAIGNATVNSTINSTALSIGSNVATFGTTFYSVANGNVGIGTSSPANTLDVVGTARVSGTTTNKYNLNSTSVGNWKSFISYQSNGSAKWEVGSDIGAIGINDFYIYDNVAATTRLYISNTGNIGIGTTSPSARLNVVGHNEYALGLTAQTSSAQTPLLSHPVALLYNSNATVGNGLNIRYQIADTGGVARTAGGVGMISTAKDASSVTADMYFYTGSTEKMRIDSAGNVGIGTSTPSNTLSVTGTAGISGALTVNGAITTGNTNLGNNQVATVAFAIAAAIAF